jgi:L-threonine kinase
MMDRDVFDWAEDFILMSRDAMESYPPSRTRVRLSESQKRTGEALSFGTFGELLQGALPEESGDFLVTFPIQRYTRATFSVEPQDGSLSVSPPVKQKSLKLARLILEHYGLPCRGSLEVASDIPEGKGLASSSADLVATARALASCYDLPISYQQLEAFLRVIEPTDGVMYPGVVAFYHQKVTLKEFLGQLPPLTVVSIDEGGVVDTVEFNRRPKGYCAEERKEFLALLHGIKGCIERGDLEGLGRITTRSAVMNQRLNPKQNLEDLIEISREVGALGVVTAHSGTCVGVLLSRDDEAYQAKLEKTTESMGGFCCPIEVYESWSPRADEDDQWSSNDGPLLAGCG